MSKKVVWFPVSVNNLSFYNRNLSVPEKVKFAYVGCLTMKKKVIAKLPVFIEIFWFFFYEKKFFHNFLLPDIIYFLIYLKLTKNACLSTQDNHLIF